MIALGGVIQRVGTWATSKFRLIILLTKKHTIIAVALPCRGDTGISASSMPCVTPAGTTILTNLRTRSLPCPQVEISRKDICTIPAP